MRWTAMILVGLVAAFSGAQPGVKPPDPPKLTVGFPTGAKPTPVAKIVEAIQKGRATIHRATAAPPSVIVVPKRLSYWGNNQYGCCVTSESVFAIADYSTSLGMEEIFVSDSATTAWASKHGWLNGAFLLDVIQDMQADGIKDEKGILRKAGKPSAVDFGNEEVLKSAIAQGPVSIAIASGRLPSGAGNKSGWYAFGGNSNQNTDHCVSLHGYGATADLFKALNVTAPSNVPANGYFLFTWSTIGVVDHAWIMSTVVEGWVRNPTTTDLAPMPPQPPPVGTITVAVPPAFGGVGVPVKITPTASGGTSPYIFLFDYGDSAQDAAGTHTYKAAGSYKVVVTAVDSMGGLGTGTCTATIGTTPPPPPPPPGPGVAGTITWTLDGKTSNYELFPPGTRDKLRELRDLIGPIAP